jgi:hypothetical protein
MITIVPGKSFRVSVTNVGPNGRFTQYFSTEVTPEPMNAKSRRPHLRLLRGRQAAARKGPDQGRLAGKRRGHPRQRGDEQGADALPQRVRPPQGARPDRRPDALRRAHPRPCDRRQARPRPEHQRWPPPSSKRIRPDALDGPAFASPPARAVLDINEVLASCPTATPS